MYTRFKSKKNGINIGMMTIVNSSSNRARCIAPSSSSSSTSSSSTSTSTTPTLLVQPPQLTSTCLNSDGNTNTDLSSSSSSSSLSSSTVNLSILNKPNERGTINLIEKDDTINFENINSMQYLVYGDPFGSEFLEENSTSIKSKLKKSNNLKPDEKRMKKSETKPYKSSRSKTVAKKDELTCKQDDEEIKYVKSIWEQYAYQIGTDDGPLLYEIDENDSEFPHLNGFVPFDMEYWWAERSISSMINENLQKTNVPHSKSTKNNYEQSQTLIKDDTSNMNSNQIENELNKTSTNAFNLNSYQMTPSAMSIASILISSSKSKYNTSLSKAATTSLKPFNLTNNLQLCFS